MTKKEIIIDNEKKLVIVEQKDLENIEELKKELFELISMINKRKEKADITFISQKLKKASSLVDKIKWRKEMEKSPI